MAYDGKIDWRGCEDGTPSASPNTNARNAEGPAPPRGDAWKGLEDNTPASKPTAPNKD